MLMCLEQHVVKCGSIRSINRSPLIIIITIINYYYYYSITLQEHTTHQLKEDVTRCMDEENPLTGG